MLPLVSVIVPVYNVEKFLGYCMDSILAQTYTNLEIIVVDDGSTDNCPGICDDYAKQDDRVKVIHKVNGGLSSARNSGIEVATGEYIFFVDSDDYISDNCVEKCMDLCMENNADISIVRMLMVSEDSYDKIEIAETKTITMDSETAIEETLYQKNFRCTACAKMYKREVIGNVRFPYGKLCEDLAVCHLFMDAANKIVYSDAVGYYYRQRAGSIMNLFNAKRLDALEWALMIEDYCKNKHPKILPAAICRTFNVAVHLLLDLPDDGEVHDAVFGRIWEQIVRTRMHTLFDKKVRAREKAAALFSFGGEKLLKFAWNSKFAIKQKQH